MIYAYFAAAFGGAHEDAWETVLVASTDEQKIKLFVAEKEKRIEALKEIKQQVAIFAWQYDKDHIFDREVEYEKVAPTQKFPSDQRLITPEMRKERNAIRIQNEEIVRRNSEKWKNFYTIRNNEIRRFAESIGLDETIPEGMTVESFLSTETNVSYRIDKVEMI